MNVVSLAQLDSWAPLDPRDQKENLGSLDARAVPECWGGKEKREILSVSRAPPAPPGLLVAQDHSTAPKEQFSRSLPDHTAKHQLMGTQIQQKGLIVGEGRELKGRREIEAGQACQEVQIPGFSTVLRVRKGSPATEGRRVRRGRLDFQARLGFLGGRAWWGPKASLSLAPRVSMEDQANPELLGLEDLDLKAPQGLPGPQGPPLSLVLLLLFLAPLAPLAHLDLGTP